MRLLRAIHQYCIDNGSWDSASLLLPGKDPCERNFFGGTEAELETHRQLPRGAEEAAEGQPVLGAGGEAWRRRRAER